MLGVPDVHAWVAEAERDTLAALERLGEATTTQLARRSARTARKLRVNVGKKYEANVGMSTRIVLLLATEGRIVRARPRGTWISSQYRWATMERWLGGPIEELPTGGRAGAARGRWLGRFGPATETDVAWWMGWTLRDVRAALVANRAVEVDLDGRTGYVLADDLDPTPAPEPWVALLPGLDPTTMGWKERDWYLGGHKDSIFDTAGNGGPTIWSDGRIVGGWAIRPNGEVVTRFLEDVGRDASAAVDAEAARLTTWLQSARVVPRFPSPLHRELVG